MTSKSFSLIFGILFLIFLLPLNSEEQIDIWKNEKNITIDPKKEIEEKNSQSVNINQNKIKANKSIIEENSITENDQAKVFGIYDPAEFGFNLNMWSSTKGDDIKASIKRINKINLSKTSNEILENILLSFSYPPPNMTEDEFVNLKLNWLIDNEKTDLVENFLVQNKEFRSKKRAVQFLVDDNISKADIKEGCNKIKFIDSTIKDSYLEKFKIYCLVFNNKKNEARLLLDLLREQNQSDKFFDDKINYLLGISNKTVQKIDETNLLNFYLSSVTMNNFKYEPTNKTKKEIWKYLNSADLIKVEDVSDKTKIKNLELAANQGRLEKKTIFNIYRQVPFNLNNLINAKSIYQTLDQIEARALIYQKYLLAEDEKAQVEYLFILEELFKKDNIQNIYREFLSDALKKIDIKNVPENYQEIVQKRILSNEEIKLGRVKYNDKILHQSKVLKFYIENESQKKVQKDIDKIFKKIGKNKKYFYSAKDLALVDTLIKDGFNLPTNINHKELSKKYDIPKNLLDLVKNNQNAFLALKIVEIIGEDEPNQLDPETIYFITSLLNEMNLIKIRNKVLISALPQRV